MNPRILMVEDEELLRWSLKEQLSKKGYVVLEAENGAQATKQFDTETPDTVYATGEGLFIQQPMERFTGFLKPPEF